MSRDTATVSRDTEACPPEIDASTGTLPSLSLPGCQSVKPVPDVLLKLKPSNSSARQDTVIPLHTPVTGVDGTIIKDIPVTRGTSVLVSILLSNRNPALWGPDALEWKLERWL